MRRNITNTRQEISEKQRYLPHETHKTCSHLAQYWTQYSTTVQWQADLYGVGILSFKFNLKVMYMGLNMCLCPTCVQCLPKRPKSMSESLELELWVSVWVLGTETKSSARATSVVNSWAIISPAQIFYLLIVLCIFLVYQLPLSVIVERKSWGSPTLNSQNKDNYSVTCPRRSYFLLLIPKQTIWHQIKPPSTKTFVNKCIVNIDIYKRGKTYEYRCAYKTYTYLSYKNAYSNKNYEYNQECVCLCVHAYMHVYGIYMFHDKVSGLACMVLSRTHSLWASSSLRWD